MQCDFFSPACVIASLKRSAIFQSLELVGLCVLTEQGLEGHPVGAGVSLRLPLGAQTRHPHLVSAQVRHPQVHCRKDGEEEELI